MKRLSLGLGAAAVLLVMFFHQGLTANPTSRLLTVWALVEDHTLRADRFFNRTWDVSLVDSHLYSDKAPLASLVATPAYALYRAFRHGPATEVDREASNHLAILVASAIPFAVFVVLVFWRLVRAGLLPPRAVWAALLVGLGTFASAYGGAFFGHMLAATLLLGAWIGAGEREQPFVAGLLGGAAIACEYTTALGVVAIGALFYDDRRRALRFAAGVVPGLLLILGHNLAVTGLPWRLPYAQVQPSFAVMRHAFGFRMPNWLQAWELVFSQYRGALFYAPLLGLLVPLLVARFDGPRRRQVVLLALASAYLVLMSGFNNWEGGWCTGPRHLLPPIALLLYEGAGAWARTRRFVVLFAALGVLGLIVNLTFAATDPTPPASVARPMLDVAYPAFVSGKINPHNLPSELLGVRPARVLLFAFAALGVALAGLLRRASRR